ncbi:MAG: DMT family transporter [Acholeplasmataceae bacterium]|nr:DMT family transporter [Acholeplasmataceae bacterium]
MDLGKGEITLSFDDYAGPAYLTLAAGIWGGMYVVSKIVLDVVPPLLLLWLRYVVALAALLAIGVFSGADWRIRKNHVTLILSVGLIGYFLSIWAQFVGTKLSTAQMGAVITSATPAFMVIFAYFLLREKITIRKVFSMLLATIGVLLVVGVGGTGESFQLGGVILVIAALSWALMSVLVKRIPPAYSPLVITTYAIMAATLAITPLSYRYFTAEHLSLIFEPTVLLGVLYIGIVATAGAFLFWNKGLQLIDASRGGIYFFFQPLVGTLLGWLFLGEQVGLGFLVGALLILSGVFLVIRD